MYYSTIINDHCLGLTNQIEINNKQANYYIISVIIEFIYILLQRSLWRTEAVYELFAPAL